MEKYRFRGNWAYFFAFAKDGNITKKSLLIYKSIGFHHPCFMKLDLWRELVRTQERWDMTWPIFGGKQAATSIAAEDRQSLGFVQAKGETLSVGCPSEMNYIWLVVWNMNFMTFIFFRGVGQPPSRYELWNGFYPSCHRRHPSPAFLPDDESQLKPASPWWLSVRTILCHCSPELATSFFL